MKPEYLDTSESGSKKSPCAKQSSPSATASKVPRSRRDPSVGPYTKPGPLSKRVAKKVEADYSPQVTPPQPSISSKLGKLAPLWMPCPASKKLKETSIQISAVVNKQEPHKIKTNKCHEADDREKEVNNKVDDVAKDTLENCHKDVALALDTSSDEEDDHNKEDTDNGDNGNRSDDSLLQGLLNYNASIDESGKDLHQKEENGKEKGKHSDHSSQEDFFNLDDSMEEDMGKVMNDKNKEDSRIFKDKEGNVEKGNHEYKESATRDKGNHPHDSLLKELNNSNTSQVNETGMEKHNHPDDSMLVQLLDMNTSDEIINKIKPVRESKKASVELKNVYEIKKHINQIIIENGNIIENGKHLLRALSSNKCDPPEAKVKTKKGGIQTVENLLNSRSILVEQIHKTQTQAGMLKNQKGRSLSWCDRANKKCFMCLMTFEDLESIDRHMAMFHEKKPLNRGSIKPTPKIKLKSNISKKRSTLSDFKKVTSPKKEGRLQSALISNDIAGVNEPDDDMADDDMADDDVALWNMANGRWRISNIGEQNAAKFEEQSHEANERITEEAMATSQSVQTKRGASASVTAVTSPLICLIALDHTYCLKPEPSIIRNWLRGDM